MQSVPSQGTYGGSEMPLQLRKVLREKTPNTTPNDPVEMPTHLRKVLKTGETPVSARTSTITLNGSVAVPPTEFGEPGVPPLPPLPPPKFPTVPSQSVPTQPGT